MTALPTPKPTIRYRRPASEKATKPAVSAPKRQHVYVMRAGGFVKIGRTYDVLQRLTVLQIGCPLPMSLAVAIPGGETLEKALPRGPCPAGKSLSLSDATA